MKRYIDTSFSLGYYENMIVNSDLIIWAYKRNISVSKISNMYQISRTKVRKILIDNNLLTSPLIIKIKELKEQGLNKKDICEKLSISFSTYNDNVRYSKCVYYSENRSKQALRSERFRIREMLYKERIRRLKGERHGV